MFKVKGWEQIKCRYDDVPLKSRMGHTSNKYQEGSSHDHLQFVSQTLSPSLWD